MNHKFDHEKLDVYQLQLKFIGWVTPLIAEVKKKTGSLVTETCDHLERASLSSLFNTAEGNGKRSTKLRRRYFDDARGSASECAACLDALVAKNSCGADRIVEGKEMLYRIVSMLSKLVQRYSSENSVRESTAGYSIENDYEDEHENEL